VNAAPGSIRWLLGHELRLAWYGATRAGSGGKKRFGTSGIVILTLGWLLLHGLAFIMLRAVGGAHLRDPLMSILAGGVLLVCATFMLSGGLKACVTALFERGDLDLLLSSPLPSRSIFAVRLMGVVVTTALSFVYLFSPFANVAVFFGQPGWLAIYPAVIALAALGACGAMLLTLALVRVLGARRTRVVGQVVAAIAGALLFLTMQAYNFVSHGSGRAATEQTMHKLAQYGVFAPTSALWLPGRAALGEALPLLGLAALALAACVLTVGLTHRFFVHGLQQAAGMGRAAPRPAGSLRFRFRSSLFDTVVVKEWRLIARDPHLISQVLLQMIYLVPLLFLILRDSSAAGPAVGVALTLLCSSLTGGLAWIVISAEDAPDLLCGAPVAMRTIRLAKLAAATMPPLMLIALPLLWLVVRAPLIGILAAFTVTGAVLGAGLIVLWVGRPAPRSNFKTRGKENGLCTALEMVNTIGWGGSAWCLMALTGQGSNWLPLAAAATLALALGNLLLAWLLRRSPG